MEGIWLGNWIEEAFIDFFFLNTENTGFLDRAFPMLAPLLAARNK